MLKSPTVNGSLVKILNNLKSEVLTAYIDYVSHLGSDMWTNILSGIVQINVSGQVKALLSIPRVFT